MRLLRASDHKRMPWKNGGGETVEIAVFPPAASVDDFDWRISMATVASDGPFSIFPGIDRTLSILHGNGMVLAINGQPPVLLETDSVPLAFPADIPVNASLRDGPITDLNVMTRRGAFTHRVERLASPFTGKATGAGEAIIVLAVEPISLKVNDRWHRLEKLDAALITDEASFEMKSVNHTASLLLIRVFPANI